MSAGRIIDLPYPRLVTFIIAKPIWVVFTTEFGAIFFMARMSHFKYLMAVR
jgi:hypothetical protein